MPIVDAVIDQKAEAWNEATREVAHTDAQRVLESLVAEYGIEAALEALDKQGFKGEAYIYLLNPLHAEALRRRS